MSCSTTSLLAGTITTKNTLTIEDPYIFTETVPTKPPILFSNSQKSKIRFEAKPQKQQNLGQTTAVVAGGGGGGSETPIAVLRATAHTNSQANNNRDSLYVKGRNYVAQTQTQTSPENFAKFSPAQQQQLQTNNNSNIITQTPPTAVLAVLNTNNIKKYEKKTTVTGITKQQQQPQRQQKHAQHMLTAQNENIIEKSSQPPQQQQPKLLSTTPPPLLLSHTPSLWQTPLLLESTSTATTTPTALTAKNPTVTKISQPPPRPLLSTATALVTPPLIIGGGGGGSAVVPGTGTVAPLHLLMPSAAPLPPSNFHHTTLAQHLQKLQCLKKSKKADASPTAANLMAIQAKITTTNTLASSTTLPTTATALPNQNQKHSTTTATANDLNEIPVNVIYRAATLTSKTPLSMSPTVSQTPHQSCAKKELPPARTLTHSLPQSPQPTSFPYAQAKRKNLLTLPPSSSATPLPSPSQLQRNVQTNGIAAKVVLPALTPQQNVVTQNISSPPTVQNSVKKVTNPKPKATATAKRRSAKALLSSQPHSHQKAQKRFRKSNIFPALLNERERAALPMLPDVSLSTKAVAIVKRPFNEFAEFDSNFYADNENELPFCVQRHWFSLHQQLHSPARLSSVGGCRSREERISSYKSVLRRQAMQLLATRSLQRLPFNVARKRLICVDTLLRKYRDHNKINSLPSKKCEIEFCENLALTMTTLCQQHMVKNSKQSIFVLCSAKNLTDDFQQQQQTTANCNVPVLNIQKQYSPPLCYRHLSKQKLEQKNQQKQYQQPLQQTQRRLNNFMISSTKAATVATTMRKRKSTGAVNNNAKPSMLTVDFSNFAKMDDANTTTALTSRHLNSRTMNMQRKNSTTSLESIASNSQSSFGSVITAATTNLPSQTASNMISPPALAPLSYNTPATTTKDSHQSNGVFPACVYDPVAEQEINKLVAQFAMAAAAKSGINNNNNISSSNKNNQKTHNNNNNNHLNSFNFMMNTNSNSNLTSSGVGGSSSSLPSSTADELLTQDMLSNCENSSAYASSSEDTGLGELSESELLAVSSSIAENITHANALVSGFSNIGNSGDGGGCDGSGAVSGSNAFNDDDVIPDEIPLGDARLLEENDLVNVFGTLPVNLNELFNAVVQQDEREEVERALEIADKHLRSLQQTIGSESDFLADLLDVDDDMLAVGDDVVDICSKMEIVSSVLPPNESLEAAALYLENADKLLSNNGVGISGVNSGVGGVGMAELMGSNQQLAPANITMPANCANNKGANNNGGILDIRGLLQT